MQNLNLPAKKQHNKPKVMDILQNKGLYSSKLTIHGEKGSGLSQVKGYMTTKIKFKRN